MKKILFFAATVTMLFAACTNEDLVAPQTGAETTLEDGAVGFDVYLPGATAQTRAGRAGVMTTGVLQQTGFGIYGYQTDNTGYDPGTSKPNYMWNQQVNFNSVAAGWYYAPLKYWPNETKNDSQTTPTKPAGMPDQTSKTNLDKLTFFAYAPWVSVNGTSGVASPISTTFEAPEASAIGITSITKQDGSFAAGSSVVQPQLYYKMAENPDYSVDLLWGVAPAGGLNYTAVNGEAVEVPEGMPLKDLVKPAVNTNIKFQFQHALARLGVKVVLAADQVASGGDFDYANTRVTIESIVIDGPFATEGRLVMNNLQPKVSRWTHTKAATGTNALKIESGKGLAPHLIYDASRATGHKQQNVTGVTTDLADAIKVSSLYDANYEDEYSTMKEKPDYSPTTPYFATQADAATPTYATYDDWAKETGKTYYQMHKTNNGVSYTNINDGDNAINTKYPNATVWKNIYTLNNIPTQVNSGNKDTFKAYKAYRLVGSTYTATGRVPEVGDYVFDASGSEETPAAVSAPKTTTEDYYAAKPNYFMVIPTNSDVEANRTLKVKITYYVSTTDASLKDGIVYTKNEVEKDVVLPHLKNGVAYDLRLILGLTSVKVEADVADWTTTGAEVNLPQNTAE